MADGRTSVDELDPMNEVEKSVDEAMAPVPSPYDEREPVNDEDLEPRPGKLSVHLPYDMPKPPENYLDTERKGPPTDPGDMP